MSDTKPDLLPMVTTQAIERDPSDVATDGPGVLRGSAWLTLQTRHAGRLVRGCSRTVGKSPVVGLLGFADGLRIIGQGARSGDPYSDWWQFKVDATLVNASSTLEAVCSVVDAHMGAVEGFVIEAAVSVQPTRVRLQFSSPFAYRGAQLLAAYDGLARRILSAQHVGLIEREDAERLLYQASVQPRVVVQRALELNAAAVVLAHKHPSDVAEPSMADQRITERLKVPWPSLT